MPKRLDRATTASGGAGRWQRVLVGLVLCLLSAVSWAQHFDVELRTSLGPVAGSRITTAFYGDLNLVGPLPIDAATGYKIFPGYFGDLEGGPYLTDDPGFQAFARTFLRREEVHFRALGTLQHWNPATGRWGDAPAGVQVALFGGIPVDVIVGYTENPAAWQVLYDYHAAGTRFTVQGIQGPPTAVIDDAGASGSFHAHLDWRISAGVATPPVGAYMVTLELWSTAQVNGVAKYVPSEPILIVFERGITEAQMQAAIGARVTPPPPPACTAAALSWLVGNTGCSGPAEASASGVGVTVLDSVGPALGSARFVCTAGQWGSASAATCAVPPPQACAGRLQTWTVGAEQCTGATPAAASGDSAVATDATVPTLGSAVFACTDGSWGLPTAASCAVPPPAACSPVLGNWSVAGVACSGVIPGTESGNAVLANDVEEPNLGSARFGCTDGRWSSPSEARCTAPPPPRPCASQALGWTVLGEQCSAVAPAATSGGSVAIADAVAPAIGSAVFSCSNGNWGAATVASCAVPPPMSCAATAGTWSVAGVACSAALPPRPSGGSVVVVDAELPETGSASFVCSDGRWGSAANASCTAPLPPQACNARTLGWASGGVQCSGDAAAAASGASSVVTDDIAPTLGSAVFACTDGNWGLPTASACRLRTPAACPAQVTSWAVAGHACDGRLPDTASGGSIWLDDTTQPNTGRAMFACENGLWSVPAQAVCMPPPPPRSCNGGVLSWDVTGRVCSAQAATTASGRSALLQDTLEPTLGSALFACSDGTWGPPTAAVCAVPAPLACSAAVVPWSESGRACSASIAGGESGSEVTAVDQAAPDIGSARFRCSNGSWGTAIQALCAPIPAPRPCSAQILGWAIDGVQCSAAATTVASGASLTLDDAEAPTLGSAVFACLNGNWGASVAARCAVPPPRACPAQQLSWSVGGQMCDAAMAAAASGAASLLHDVRGPTLGSARFRCGDGVWQPQPQPQTAPSCGAFNLTTQRTRPRSPWEPPPTLPWQAP